MSPTIYLSTILGLVISAIVARMIYGNWKFKGEILEDFIAPGVVAGFIVGIITWLAVGDSYQPDTKIQYEKNNRELVLLKDGSSISGNFFLGCGNFDSGMEYYGYESLGNDSYKMVTFDNSTLIIEDIKEGEKPYFVEVRKKADISKIIKYDKWMIGPSEMDEFVRWEIHIPKNSILKNEYKLDAQ